MRIRLIFATVVLICAISPFAYSKEWYQLYDDGKKAVEKKNCVEGTRFLKEALQKQPTPNLKARPYGTITWEYIPHFYLAKCAVESGDYAAAEMYLSDAKKVDMYSSSKSAEYRTMVKAVEEKLKTKPGGTQVAQNPQNTNPPPKTPTDRPQTTTPPIITPTTPNKNSTGTNQQALIDRSLEDARSAFESGDYEEARNAANRVLMLDRGNREANRLLVQISSKESSELAGRAKQQKIDEARRAMNRGNITEAESVVLQLRAEYPNDRAIESLAAEIQKQKQAKVQNMQEAETRLMAERQVVRAYFEGKYEAVIQLTDTWLSQHPTSWRLHFYKGCAYAALGLLDDKTKESRLSQAREAFKKARQTGGTIAQPSQLSPKIWDLYKNS